jgi:hypothetical protein
VQAARQNVQNYSWAKTLKDAAVAKAERYLAEGHNFLWNVVPPQSLPRSTSANLKLGSPVTGMDIYQYGSHPWTADPLNEPWKIVDPSSGYKFPTNDFQSYYESGLNAHGIFDPNLADPAYLVNELYPEKGPTWGVDNGSGWVDENGNTWTFVAHYVGYFVWYGQGKALIEDAIRAFRDAYLYTGDIRYARGGGILLDRIADVYPDLVLNRYDLNKYSNSHKGTGLGKAVGSIWEAILVKDFLSAYDAFFTALDDPSLIAFLSAKAQQFDLDNPKNTADAIRKNIEDGIVREVFPAFKGMQIYGNTGMHQSALSMAAVVLDSLPETQQWLDYVMQSGGPTSTGGLWVEFDATARVRSEAQGDQKLSFRVFDPVAHSSGPTYHSREASDVTLRPQLALRLTDGRTEIVNAEADSYVRGGSYAGQNFGASSWLYIRNAGAGVGNTRESYFRFDLSGINGEIEQATARLRLVSNMTVSGMTNKAEWIEDDNWSEATIKWNNRPSGSGTTLGEWTIPTSPRLMTGGGILQSLVNLVDRDGNGNEGAPGYNRLWLDHFIDAAEVLEGYDLYPVADLYQNVKFRKLFSGLYPLLLSEIYTPTIGDYGKTGNPAREVKLDTMVKAFEKFADPVFAQMAYLLNNNSVEGLHGDIWSSTPESVAVEIMNVIAEHGPLNLPSMNMTGYGFGALRDGTSPASSFGLVYKFPSLNIVHQSANVKLFADSGTVQFEATQPGETLSFSFEVAAADEYELAILPFKASSYGTYRISVDGVAAGQLDFYGGNTTEPETITTLFLTEGSHTITFEGIGKHASASNYKMGVRDLFLLNEAAIQMRDEQLTAENTLRDLWMYYGRSVYHGHRDTLNLGLHAFGLDLAPDLGYPEFANDEDPHRHQWVNNTVSHNTVVVDQTKQRSQWVATPLHFDDSGQVKLIDVEAPRVYPGTDLYRRSTAMIRADEANSYMVDFFRVNGGSDHHFSFHGPDAQVTTANLNLTPQPTGTYAGETVEYGECPGCSIGSYTDSGFHYLKQVRRDNAPGGSFSVDWKAKDTWNVLGGGANAPTDVHLRLTMLGEMESVALAEGVPPQNKPGNPASLTYMLAHRQGQNLQSAFTSVLEPYKGTRFIQSVEAVPVKRDGVLIDEADDISVRAVKVVLEDGRTDYIVNALDPSVEYTIDDKYEFKGFFGVYAEKQGQRVYSYVHDGSYIIPLQSAPVAAVARLEGTIVDFTKEPALQNHLDVEFSLPGTEAEMLLGKWIYVRNDGIRNAAYEIRGATSLGGNMFRLQLGDATLVRAFVDADDFSQGYTYDVAAGQSFYIPFTTMEEQALPSTTAFAAGSETNGWLTGDAAVSIEVQGDAAKVKQIEYSLDGGVTWAVYAPPLVLSSSGLYTLYYRADYGEWGKEPAKTLDLRIDRTAPTITLLANGSPVADPIDLSGLQSVSFSVYASDGHSGVVGTVIAVNGAAYTEGAPLDLFDVAGGTITVQVSAADNAGNTASANYSFDVGTQTRDPLLALRDLEELGANLLASGDIHAMLGQQLSYRIGIVRLLQLQEAQEQAIAYLEDFVAYIQAPALLQQGLISAYAVAALETETAGIIVSWRG